MTPTAVILEAATAYKRGLQPALIAAGFDIDKPSADGRRVLLAPLRDPMHCERFEGLAADGDAIAVALIPSDEPDMVVHAIGHGAAAAVPWDAEPERIAAAALAAIEGNFTLPLEAARTLARRGPGFHRDRPLLDATEVAWIVELSRGSTVVGLADRYGYSERAMFRRLGELYTRLGASNRSEALVAAQRAGLLDPTDRI